MRQFTFITAAALALQVLPVAVGADGCLMVDEATWRARRERALINEPEQKAVVFFSKGTEQLIISPSYEGPSSNFAWVVPVPSRPKVEILEGAIFHELARLVSPPPTAGKFVAADRAALAEVPAVTVLERKTVGSYDVSVLSANDSGALMRWLSNHKYHLPEKARAPVNSYIKQRWTFVACRIKAPGSAKGLKTGTLAPLKLTFKADGPVYPLRISAANPEPFDLLVYLVVPSNEAGRDERYVGLVRPCGIETRVDTRLAATLEAGQDDYPTLAKLSTQDLTVYRVVAGWKGKMEPRHCTNDLFWDVGARHAETARVHIAEVR